MHGLVGRGSLEKEGSMNAALRFLVLAMVLAVTSCGKDETDEEEVRVQREIDRRVEIIRNDLKTAENAWHTVRVSAFCILAGGCLIWLLGGNGANPSGRGGRPRLTGSKPDEQAPGRRIIDRDNAPYDHEHEDDPYHR